MKKIILLMGVLLSLGMFSACSDDDEITDVIEGEQSTEDSDNDQEGLIIKSCGGGVVYDGWGKPEVDTSDPLAVFFRDELHDPYWDGVGNVYMTFFGQVSWDDESCLVINSNQEFQHAYMGTKELPDVDFNEYTLIIGRTWGNDSSYKLGDVILTNKGDNYELETKLLHYVDWGAYMSIVDIYYWRLYPKLKDKSIVIKRTVEDVKG